MSHISDIKKMERCEKLYWLSQRKTMPYVAFVYYNENMMELVKEYFMIVDCFCGEANDDPALAMNALQEYSMLINARFAYQNLRIKIPLMIKNETGWNVYFTFTTLYPREGNAICISDHLCVLKACGIQVKEVYAIHLNSQYIRKEELDVRSLFVVTPYLYNPKNQAKHSIQNLVKRVERDVFALLPRLSEIDEMEMIESVRTKACTRGSKCTYYEECFPNEKEPSIAHLFGAKLEFMKQGIQEISEVDFSQLEGTRQQYAQYMAAKTKQLYMDHYAVQTWVEQEITYPISYLDFEWETYAFPPYHGMKPYDVLAFQYSLHVEDTHLSELKHYEFLQEGDCREAFIQQLLQDLPSTGTILVFNMEGAEKLRLKQLAQQFPKYKEVLDAVCDRMVDLSLPFATGNIYDEAMNGYYSLKKLVDVFSDYSYQDLKISYGMGAVFAWRAYPMMDEEEKVKTREALLAYCAMDTFGEVIVFHKIKELLER